MSTVPPHDEAEVVGRGHERADLPTYAPERHPRFNVLADDKFDLRVLEAPTFDERERSAPTPFLLRGLENELHRPGEGTGSARHDRGRPQEAGHVDIMAARVHSARELGFEG
jgi:hypothetical protein